MFLFLFVLITLLSGCSYNYDEDKIIYFDNEVSSIAYNIKFDYEETDETFKLHEEFVKNSGLNNLNHESIYYFKKSAFIFLYFSPETDTTEVQEFMNKLKQDNQSIISIERNIYYRYSSVYIHNPLYYRLEESEKLNYQTTNPSILTKGIYKNIKDIEKAINAYFDMNSDKSYIINRKEEITKAIKSTYNEDYFEKSILIVTDTITTGSGSNRQELNSIYLKDNKLYIFLKMYFINMGTCDEQSTVFGITIDKNMFNDLDNLKKK